MRTPPISTIPHHGVEDGEQLPHARYQGHLLGFACRQKPLVKLLESRVVAGGEQGTHGQGSPHRSPPAPYFALAPNLSGVAVEGSDPHQGREALVGDGPEFGQLGQKRPGEHGSHPRHAPKQLLVTAPNLALLDRLVEFAVGALQLLLEPADVGGSWSGSPAKLGLPDQAVRSERVRWSPRNGRGSGRRSCRSWPGARWPWRNPWPASG